MKVTTEQYIEFIKNAVATADIANKLALDMEAITLDQYLEAAHILVDAYLAQKGE
jgi:hypothetical protein